MSESKPSDEASLIAKVLSEPRSFRRLGINWDDTCLRTQWQPVWRRHELETGSGTERENLASDAKGNDKWGTTRKNTDAEARGGAARSSDEALVTRVERRGGVIRSAIVINLRSREE